MKVTLPFPVRKPAPIGQRALTLLEMMVAVALLMFIVLGLTQMFLQTQKAFKTGLRQVDVFESERLVMDMLTRDFEQMADAGKGTNCYTFYFAHAPAQQWVQYYETQPFRTNYAQDIFTLTRVNNQWIGIGYSVSNSLTTQYPAATVGTLYRYTTNVPVSSTNNWLLTNNILFRQFIASIQNPQNPYTNFHRVADGIIHLSVRTFDTNGNFGTNSYGYVVNTYPYTNEITSIQNKTNHIDYVTVPLPGFVEVELGMLEPETFEQARSMGNYPAATNFLAKRVGRVHVFRQQIPIRAASR